MLPNDYKQGFRRSLFSNTDVVEARVYGVFTVRIVQGSVAYIIYTIEP